MIERLLFFLTLLVLMGCGRTLKNEDCVSLRTGQFYFHPSGETKTFFISRAVSIQKECVIGTKDTSYWKNYWIDDCNYSMEYISGGDSLLKSQPHHTVDVEILEVRKEYYIMQASVKEFSYYKKDTIWRQPINF